VTFNITFPMIVSLD